MTMKKRHFLTFVIGRCWQLVQKFPTNAERNVKLTYYWVHKTRQEAVKRLLTGKSFVEGYVLERLRINMLKLVAKGKLWI